MNDVSCCIVRQSGADCRIIKDTEFSDGFGRMETGMQEMNGIDRRRYKRLPIKLHLEVNEVFKQDNIIIKELNASIKVLNISKSGIGFASDASLPLGYYFNARIHLGDKDFFDAVIRIVRASLNNEQKFYGAEFVGLAPFLENKVDLYERLLEKREIQYR